MFHKVLVSTALIVSFGLVLSAPQPQDLYENKASPYEFGFKIADEYGNVQHRQESGDADGNKKGSYGYSDAYGLYRNVEYVADGYGFKAYINSNEPGLGDEDPADATIDKSGSPPDAHKITPKAPKVIKPVKVRGSYKATRVIAPQRVHAAPAPHLKQTLVHADPSFTLNVAQLPDLKTPILRKRGPRVPKPQIIQKEAPAPHPVSALIKDPLTVGYKEPQDLYKLPPHAEANPHSGPKGAPAPHPDGPYEEPKTTLKTFTEKPAQKPEYRPRFASKANTGY